MTRRCLLILFLAACTTLYCQAPPKLAVIAQVKKENIQLRWAPADAELWQAGITYGYRIERVTLQQYKESSIDSLRFKNATLLRIALFPWKKDDERWKLLLAKNKSAAFLYGSLYASDKKTTPQKKEMSFAMLMKACDLHKDLSKAHGLLVADTVPSAASYVYRVTVNAPKNKYPAAIVIVDAAQVTNFTPIAGLKAKFGDKRVVLRFVTKDVKDYSGYWIERSEDSVNYVAVNKTPFIRTTTKYDADKTESLFADSFPKNEKKYFYRVKGITCFGESEPASNVVSGMGHAAMDQYPIIDSAVAIKNSTVLIRFHMPEKFEKATLKGLMICRNEKRTGNYVAVSNMLSPQSTQFTDEKPLETNYYRVVAYNQYDDSSYSMTAYVRLLDETPPATPAGLTGTIDSTGVVRVTWVANTEKDLLGYRVFRCNSMREQPFELTRKLLTQTAFKDSVTLKTLTREVYYTVRAVDKVHNNSEFSTYFKLMRPDKIKPVAITFSKILATDSCILLVWNKSNSNDVQSYKLNRKENGGAWQSIKQWQVNEQPGAYCDNSIVAGHNYTYRVEVADGSGNYSFTESHEILFKPAFYPKIEGLKDSVNRELRSVTLHWPEQKNAYSYTLYKAKGDEPLQTFKTLEGRNLQFVDKEVYPNNMYRYAIKATLKSGSETKLSDVLRVDY